VLLVDDHPAVRLGVRALIGGETDLSVCGEASSMTAALGFVRDMAPDVVVTDTDVTGGDAIELIRRVREIGSAARVLVFSRHHEIVTAERLIRAGASGYLMKSAPPQELLRAIRLVAAGERYLSAMLVDVFHGRFLQPDAPIEPAARCVLDVLSAREFQVFQMAGRGMTHAAMASALAVSTKTVETLLYRTQRKLCLSHQVQFKRCAAECAWHCRLAHDGSGRCEAMDRMQASQQAGAMASA
jgi:DNA-binding NarL/FixJ family response regulator